MLIDSLNAYKNDLFSLWKEAFGDEDGYINLFFDTAYKNCVKVFAEFSVDRIVSALYLFPSYITVDGITYEGYYLYAAATLKSHRGKGIMGKLIYEAKDYTLNQNRSFISLVPGEDYLYSYYKKFGFEALMYRGKDIIKCLGNEDITSINSTKLSKYFEKRKALLTAPAHHLSDEAYSYAVKCYEYLALKAFDYGDSAFIYDSSNKCIKELLSSNTKLLAETLNEGIYTVYSPFGKEKENFGMVWLSADSIKINDIYMNIALD